MSKMDLKLSERQVVMVVFSYLPSPIISFQVLNRRFYRNILPQWVGFATFLDLSIRVLPRPVHCAYDTYSLLGTKYIQGLSSLDKSKISVTGLRYCDIQGSLELELSTGLKSSPESSLVFEQIPTQQITSVQTFHNMKQKWIGVTLKGRDGQYSCGSTQGLSNTYSLLLVNASWASKALEAGNVGSEPFTGSK